MSAPHIEFLVEEPSMEAFLRELLPRMLPDGCEFNIHPHQGKSDLLDKLYFRLCGYAKWLPKNWRIIVVVDRDNDNCTDLKTILESAAQLSGLMTWSQTGPILWQIATRIAIEELEAWYFGDWQAVKTCYPRVQATIPEKSAYRNPDEIKGGTWEALERIMQEHGYFKTGFRKVEAARAIGAAIDPAANTSRSFIKFRDAVIEAAS